MATIYWFDFRGSSGGPSGFPGEPANSVFASGSAFPSGGAVGPYTSGWQAAFGGGQNDDTTYMPTYPHQAGYMSSTAGVNSTTFEISGFVAGHTYNIYASLGAISVGTFSTGFTIWTDAARSTSILNVAGTSVPTNQFLDATGVVRTSALDWTNNNAPASITPSVTALYFGKSFSGNNAYFNAIGIEDTTAGAATASSPTLMMMGV